MTLFSCQFMGTATRPRIARLPRSGAGLRDVKQHLRRKLRHTDKTDPWRYKKIHLVTLLAARS
ncbi:MAG: hypothetical protein KL863_16720 [Rhizobium sp.]|nr:hypothetical protein [Rhizobium sp.]